MTICSKCKHESCSALGFQHRRCPGPPVRQFDLDGTPLLDDANVQITKQLPLRDKSDKLPSAQRGVWMPVIEAA